MTDRSTRYPRLTAGGAEKLDPKPKAAYISIDPDTGEVTGDMPRPRSLIETLAAATSRSSGLWSEGDEDDDDFDSDLDDGSLPLHTPHTEGFVDAMGISQEKAIKTLLKRGTNPFKPKPKVDDNSESTDNTKKEARAPKAGEPSPETSDDSE